MMKGGLKVITTVRGTSTQRHRHACACYDAARARGAVTIPLCRPLPASPPATDGPALHAKNTDTINKRVKLVVICKYNYHQRAGARHHWRRGDECNMALASQVLFPLRTPMYHHHTAATTSRCIIEGEMSCILSVNLPPVRVVDAH